MKITDIDKCVCLCLDKRQEYWKKNIKERNFGLKIEPFICGNGLSDLKYDYVDKDIPKLHNAFNCWKIIFKKLKDENIKLALLMEDDFYLTNDFLQGLDFVGYESFDICALGSYSLLSDENYHDFKLIKTEINEGFAGFHGILIKNNVYDDILNYEKYVPIDVIVGHHELGIVNKYNSKLLCPSIILQKPMFSEISEDYPAPNSGLQLAWNAAVIHGRI